MLSYGLCIGEVFLVEMLLMYLKQLSILCQCVNLKRSCIAFMMCVVASQVTSEISPLTNLGNTCFINSTVQLMHAATGVRELLLAHLCDHNDAGMCHNVSITKRLNA